MKPRDALGIRVPAIFPIPRVHKSLDENGTPKDPSYKDRSKDSTGELLCFI